tara:strand:+ start:727 stop:2268 length:1542 start_codon:yes stop_codon:yes gene_type:complete
MSNYVKSTNFTAKDSLPTGDANKVIRGSEFDTEFDALATAVATKADLAGPTFTGTATFANLTATGTVNLSGATVSDLGSITTVDINGGTIDGVTIGGSSAGAGTFSSLVATTADINAGTVDNTVIGGATPAAGSFTTLSASSTFTLGGVAVTSTAAELNILDGVTASAAELNILDGKSFVDEDDMSSNSATAIPSQQSVKAYVDSQTGLGGATLAGLADTNVTSPADAALLFYDTGTSKWIDNVVSGDITIADTGVAAIGSGVIVNADVNASAAIDVSKTALTAGTGLTLSTNTLSVNSTQTLTELDVDNIKIDANAVKSTNTNGNIELFPNGTGTTVLYGNTNPGTIVFNCESNSHGVTLKGPAHSAASTYTVALPDTLGTTQASGVVTSDANGVVTFDNGISEEYTAVTSSSNATTVNLRDGTNFSHTLTENTTFTFSNPASSGKVSAFTLKIVQDASASGYTVTWPGSVDWPSATAPTLTATASAVDYFVFITHDGGTTYYGFTAGQALG